MTNAKLKRVLLASGVLRVAARLRLKGAAILMYHSVLEDPRQAENSLGRMIHSRSVFEQQMQSLASGFHAVSLDAVLRFLKGEENLPDRAVAVTFDDGYRDNYEVALPILERFGIPAAFYSTVDCVEQRRLPWPSRLRFAFFTTRKPDWQDESGKRWMLTTPEEKEAAYLAACDRVAPLAGDPQERLILGLESDLERSLPKETGEWMMTWEQLRSLAQKGHIVGSHTMTHPNLAFVDIAAARWELVESKRRMEAKLGQPVRHFSYPCPALWPNWSMQTTEEIRGAGYQTAVTTASGLALKSDDPLAMKRVPPTKTVDGLLWNLEAVFAGKVV
jgi:peptidoglycan/xylan/chitin deacetylase (PgdA/CDA1 family)